jgi:hypothetical protein
MSLLSKKDLESLLPISGGPYVSIFLPTIRAGAEVQQNPIRFKNLVRSAQGRLQEWGMRDTDADDFLEPARRLVEDDAFWLHQSDGLAVFRSADMFKTFKLPVSFHELSVVERRFHLKPLFPLLSGDGHFYVLALSLKNIRLLSGHRFDMHEVELGDVPRSLTEALGDLTRRYTQFQVATSAKTVHRAPLSVGGGSPVFAGHGTGEDDLKAEIRKFFQIFDGRLAELDLDRRAPVVLAGVEYLLPIYRDVADTLSNIAEEALHGNAEGLRPEQIHEAAWQIVEPVFRQERDKATERFREMAGTGLASSDLQEVLPAAHDGRVESLFVPRGVRVWGSWNGEARSVSLQPEQGDGPLNGSEDLLDLAAVETYLHGGKVFAVEPQELPREGQQVAAVFRY